MAWRSQLSKNLKELRILFCQTSPASAEARSFVEKNYKELKTLNPKLPILIREARGVEPQLWARYGRTESGEPRMSQVVLSDKNTSEWACNFGVERGVRLEGMKEGQISKALEDLVKAGEAHKV